MKNRKLLIVLAGFILAVIFSAVFVILFGNRYSMHTVQLPYEQPPKTEIHFEKEGIVELENVRMDKGELVFDLKAIGPGKTKVYFSYELNEQLGMIKDVERELEVNAFCVIVDKSEGIVNFNGYVGVVIAFIGFLFLTEMIMLCSFIGYYKKGNFCYQMMASGGAAIYLAVLLFFLIYKLLNNAVRNFGEFVERFYYTGTMLLVGLAPVMFVLSVILMLSNIWLIRNEGKKPINALGIIFGILWFFATVFTVGFLFLPIDNNIFQYIFQFFNFAFGHNVLTFIVGYFECMFLSTVASSYLAAKYKPPYDRDYIIILGCGINSDGTLKPLLKDRVDRAIQFEKEQVEKTGQHVIFVPSGGQGVDECVSESEAMKRYLIEQNIPSDRILKEDKSTNTFENMQFSKKVIEFHCNDMTNKKIAFTTTNYHVFRGYILSKKIGFDVKGISARTKFYFYPNAFLREFIGLLVDRKWQHLTAIALILCLFLSLFYSF